ncbi:MAG: hypothetical protein KTQ49_06265, partial [Candidatus Omnitrophica bacterium]|nr:hypothetical protein [Candidatus Omnitrophota bacterium]
VSRLTAVPNNAGKSKNKTGKARDRPDPKPQSRLLTTNHRIAVPPLAEIKKPESVMLFFKHLVRLIIVPYKAHTKYTRQNSICQFFVRAIKHHNLFLYIYLQFLIKIH